MKKIKRVISLLLAAIFVLFCAACGKPADTTVPADTTDGEIDIDKIDLDDYYTIRIEDYKDKTLAGHIAQYVGFLSGYEFARDSSGNPRVGMPDSWFEICNGPYADPNPRNKHADKLLKNEETGLWEVWNDDDFSIDILNQYIIADMYEDYGTFTTKSIMDGWLEYDVYDMGGGHRSNGAYGLFKSKSYLPTYVGMREYGNLYGVNGEPYIANETLGMAAAGMPDVAADITDVFATVTSDMDPVLWARFFSTMYAMAYFESDISTLIAEARKTLPEGCVVHEVIDEVLALRAKYPKLSQWRDAAKEAEKICYRHHFEHDSKMGESCINCSFILIGLLWGEGDFFETLRIISLAGHGGDSTTPVGVGIVAVIDGMECIPQEALDKTWQNGEGVVVNLPIKDQKKDYWMLALGLPERIKMADVVDMYQKNFESILKENGGFIYEGFYFIPKHSAPKTETMLYENFESGKLTTLTKTQGNVSMANASETYMGEYGLKLAGSETQAGSASITVDGLKVGQTYSYSAYVYTATKVQTYMFARAEGDSSLGQFVSVYGTETCVLRKLVFTAAAEKMEIGFYMPEGIASHKYAVIDDMCVMKVEETVVTDKVSVTDNSSEAFSGSFEIKIDEKVPREAYLKINFANTTQRIIDADLTINGAEYGAVPFYKTGEFRDTAGLDCVYIPIVLLSDSNTLTFSIGDRDRLYIYDAELVTVSDRFN